MQIVQYTSIIAVSAKTDDTLSFIKIALDIVYSCSYYYVQVKNDK